MRRIGVLLLVASALVVGVAAARAAQSPRALRGSILAAARAQHSTHYATTQVVGNAVVTITGDVEAADGIQRVGLKLGKETAHLTILVSDQTLYLQGDKLGLQLLQGLTKAQAATYAGQWISIPKGDKDYSSTADGVTLGSVLQDITPRGRLAASTRKLHGKRVLAVAGITGKGKKKELKVLEARPQGKLPLEEDEVMPGKQYIARTVLKRWNEAVQVQVPSSSVPISTVRG